MTLKDILNTKGSTVYCIGPDALLSEAVGELIAHNVGALVVCDPEAEPEKPVGIITERDLLHLCGSGKCKLDSATVGEVMSTGLVTASPSDVVEQIMGVMTSKRIRHLPVCVEGRLVGLVSIGDVVKSQHDRLAMENKFMKDYIQG